MLRSDELSLFSFRLNKGNEIHVKRKKEYQRYCLIQKVTNYFIGNMTFVRLARSEVVLSVTGSREYKDIFRKDNVKCNLIEERKNQFFI